MTMRLTSTSGAVTPFSNEGKIKRKTTNKDAAACISRQLQLMPVTPPAPYRLGSATRISSTRFAIPSLRRTGLRTSGDENFPLITASRGDWSASA